MKVLLTLLTAFALCGATDAFSKTVHFPNKGDGLFSIDIPDDWEPAKDDEGTLEATSPKEHVSLTAWMLESKEDVKTLGADIVDLLKDHAKDIKVQGEPVPVKPGGLDGMVFMGTATDKESGKGIMFWTLIVTGKTGVAVIFIEGAEDTPKEEQARFNKIMESIRPIAK